MCFGFVLSVSNFLLTVDIITISTTNNEGMKVNFANQPAAIKEILDEGMPHAVAFCNEEHGYGHMLVNIRLNPKAEYRRFEGLLVITCQIGANDRNYSDQFTAPYAEKFGYQLNYGVAEVWEMEEMATIMKRVQKKLDALEEKAGRAASYAVWCERILKALGVEFLIYEPGGWNQGGNLTNKALALVGDNSLEALTNMQAQLVRRFVSRIEAA